MSDFKIFPTELSQLHTILKWIEEEFKRIGFSEKKIREVELVVEEILVNIIKYAYIDTSGRIYLSLLNLSDRMEITIKDKGAPFNPVSFEPKVNPLEMKEGGLGIPFIKHYIDEITYQRWESYNILRLVKYKLKSVLSPSRSK